MRYLFIQPHSLASDGLNDNLVYLGYYSIPVDLSIELAPRDIELPSSIAEVDVYLRLSPDPKTEPVAVVHATVVTVASVEVSCHDYEVTGGPFHNGSFHNQLLLDASVSVFGVGIGDPSNIDIGFNVRNKSEVEDIIRQLVADYTSGL